MNLRSGKVLPPSNMDTIISYKDKPMQINTVKDNYIHSSMSLRSGKVTRTIDIEMSDKNTSTSNRYTTDSLINLRSGKNVFLPVNEIPFILNIEKNKTSMIISSIKQCIDAVADAKGNSKEQILNRLKKLDMLYDTIKKNYLYLIKQHTKGMDNFIFITWKKCEDILGDIESVYQNISFTRHEIRFIEKLKDNIKSMEKICCHLINNTLMEETCFDLINNSLM